MNACEATSVKAVATTRMQRSTAAYSGAGGAGAGAAVGGASTAPMKKTFSLGEWEERVDFVNSVELDENSNELVVHLVWKDGRESLHPSNIANKACPLKMIQFYEQRLKFSRNPEGEQSNQSNDDEDEEDE